MNRKKFTVNERLHLIEQVTLKLSLEIQAIVRAIKMTSDSQSESEIKEVSDKSK